MATQRVYDITVPLSSSLAVWPGDDPVRIERKEIPIRGGAVTVSNLMMGSHAGTHVDAPLHFIPGGVAIDALDPDLLIGRALVVEDFGAGNLTSERFDALAIPPGVERLLLHTRNSAFWAGSADTFHECFTGISEDGAQWLVRRGVRLVGIDYLSVGPFGDGAGTHRVLLEAGVVVVEGLNLGGVPAGWYRLACLPLRIAGGDGAPARAVLMPL